MEERDKIPAIICHFIYPCGLGLPLTQIGNMCTVHVLIKSDHLGVSVFCINTLKGLLRHLINMGF